MYSSSGVELSRTGTSRFGAITKLLATRVTAKIAFMLATVIEVKVVKTDTSFLSIYRDIYWHNDTYFYNKST